MHPEENQQELKNYMQVLNQHLAYKLNYLYISSLITLIHFPEFPS